jgi:pentose-5-phosphate-3-epimerase
VSLEHAERMVRAGANYLVGGTSSIFARGMTLTEGVRQLRKVAEKARGT